MISSLRVEADRDLLDHKSKKAELVCGRRCEFPWCGSELVFLDVHETPSGQSPAFPRFAYSGLTRRCRSSWRCFGRSTRGY
jgi:hypothetical protein